jgi:hypothetical protein
VTQLGRFTGVARDELAGIADDYRQGLGGVLIGTDTGGAFYRPNMRRLEVSADNGAAGTGVMLSASLFLRKGDVVTNLTFRSGATALATGTHWWFALYSAAATPALMAQTADQTSAAWAALTAKTLALSAPVTIPSDGYYWAACMVAATTPPSLVGAAPLVSGGVIAAEQPLARTSGSSLAATAPATIASPTTVATVPYVVAT